MATGQRAKMLDAIEQAVTIGYRVAASKMGFFKRGEGYTPPEKDGEPVDDFTPVPQDVAAGEFWELPEGLDFEAFDPGYPGADFGEFTKSVTRSMAAGLGVSYPEFGNDFSSVSYSAGQIGVHSDMALWSDLQQFWIDAFEEPNFIAWLPMAITAGLLKLPMAKLAKFQRVKFQPPRRKHIDPFKTHKAQSIALGDMSRDPYDIAAENGVDFEDVVEGFARAKALLEKHNLRVPESWGASVELSEAESAALVADD
jgi:lambda family phage portal protein